MRIRLTPDTMAANGNGAGANTPVYIVESAPPRIQKPAPAFSAQACVPDGDGDYEFKQVSLADSKGRYLVLFFYPLDFTFVCPTEICSFSDRVGEFKALNCDLVACSCDSKFSHLAWVNTPRAKGGLGRMQIPILSDFTKEIARDYGVLLEDGEDAGAALRGTFIVDGNGTLRHMRYVPNQSP